MIATKIILDLLICVIIIEYVLQLCILANRIVDENSKKIEKSRQILYHIIPFGFILFLIDFYEDLKIKERNNGNKGTDD